MNRTRTKVAQWMGFILLIWLTSAGGICLADSAGCDPPLNFPVENPLDMEDPTNESETENDKECDEDLYDEKSFVFELKAFQNNNTGEWDRIHEDPFLKLNSPPPRFS